MASGPDRDIESDQTAPSKLSEILPDLTQINKD
jgi:hypothetical protein